MLSVSKIKRYLDIGQVLFCMFIDQDEVKAINTQKRNEANIPAILINKEFIDK